MLPCLFAWNSGGERKQGSSGSRAREGSREHLSGWTALPQSGGWAANKEGSHRKPKSCRQWESIPSGTKRGLDRVFGWSQPCCMQEELPDPCLLWAHSGLRLGPGLQRSIGMAPTLQVYTLTNQKKIVTNRNQMRFSRCVVSWAEIASSITNS